jgi:Zn-dependent protease with chaperone function
MHRALLLSDQERWGCKLHAPELRLQARGTPIAYGMALPEVTMRIPACVLLLLLAAACTSVPTNSPKPAPSPQASTTGAVALPQGVIADQVRLFEVAYPLLRAAHAFCHDATAYGMGLYALNRYAMGPLANVAWRYGIGDELKVLAAVPHSPAYRAGLIAGDVIVSVNGEPGPTTLAATRTFSLRMAQLTRSGVPLHIAARRGAQVVHATVKPEALCAYQVRIAGNEDVNAKADGRRAIAITPGMMRFARSDADLALVIAHEIAHNAMGHRNARAQLMRSLAMSGSHLPAGTANGMTPAFSQALEMEADHLALYILARAGMPIDQAPGFIRRLGDGGRSVSAQVRTHPTSAARIAALVDTMREIEDKRARGEPLVP